VWVTELRISKWDTTLTKLEDLGWDDFFASQSFEDIDLGELRPARISRHDGIAYDVIVEGGESVRARPGGGLHYRATSKNELPAVGDWAVLQHEDGELSTILAVYDRKTSFVRQSAGRNTDPQVISSNVDIVFVVTSMNYEFEPRRLERYLLAVRDAGARPVIVLSKADLTDEGDRYLAEAEQVSNGAPVIALSAITGSIDALEEFLGRGTTVVFVGSSGVGKSTLINRLMGSDVQKTGEIRAADAKGRHTTTTRQLLVLPQGRGVLIDTPGMREFQLWAGEAIVEEVFDDVAELAASCKFRDCKHDGEPGCQVQKALEAGELSRERYQSWQSLQHEIEAQQRRQEVISRRSDGRRPRYDDDGRD
jgi:ribosome biogenesis GTPase